MEGLFDMFTPKTELDRIRKTFNFLVTDFGFKLVGISEPPHFKAKYFLIYRNEFPKLQLEICGDHNWFHCEIRRLIDGEPAKYSDAENCFGYEDLAILESNNLYEHMDYFAGGSNGLAKVLVNAANLFQRNKAFFTTDHWIDQNRVEQLKNEDFQSRLGFLPRKRTFYSELKKQSMKLLSDNGYALMLDSEELSPFDSRGMVYYMVMQKGENAITIKQYDWRDDYYIYHIKVGDKIVFEMNIREHPDIDEAVQLTLEKLRDCI